MRLTELQRHVSSMEELERIVATMRAAAGMRVQEAERTLSSVRQYGDALARAVRDALAIAADANAQLMIRSSGRRRAVVLFASEHGFVGGFNERLMGAVELDLTPSDTLLILGSRGAILAAERGHSAAWTHPMATHIASIPETVRRLEHALYPRIARAEIARAEVVFARYGRGGSPIERRCLFPLELEAAGRAERGPAPLHDLPVSRLLERLTAEYIVAQLTEAAVEALAAENKARFATMESASENIGRKLEELRLEVSRARQEEITTELLDLLAGELAVS